MQLGYRASRVLAVVADRPGATNREVAAAAGVSDEGQVSRLLTRLRGLGLIHDPSNTRPGQRHSWRLTARGREALRESRAEPEHPW